MNSENRLEQIAGIAILSIAGDWLFRSASTLCVGGFARAHTLLFDISHLRLVRTLAQGPQGVGGHTDDVDGGRPSIGTASCFGLKLGGTSCCGDLDGSAAHFRDGPPGSSGLGRRHTGGRYAIV